MGTKKTYCRATWTSHREPKEDDLNSLNKMIHQEIGPLLSHRPFYHTDHTESPCKCKHKHTQKSTLRQVRSSCYAHPVCFALIMHWCIITNVAKVARHCWLRFGCLKFGCLCISRYTFPFCSQLKAQCWLLTFDFFWLLTLDTGSAFSAAFHLVQHLACPVHWNENPGTEDESELITQTQGQCTHRVNVQWTQPLVASRKRYERPANSPTSPKGLA